MNPPTPQNALQIVASVCDAHVMNGPDRRAVEASLVVLKGLVDAAAVPVPANEKKSG